MMAVSCRYKAVCATLLLLAGAPFLQANPLLDEAFSYSGFDLQMDLQTLRKRYPRSSHEFSSRDTGRTVFATDNPSRFDDVIRAGTGSYVMRLTRHESHNGLYFVQAEIDHGILRRLRLSFEKPWELKNVRGKSQIEQRHPRCTKIKAELIRLYGKPSSTGSSWEEALENISSTWVKPRELLTLNCGRYDKRKYLFAMEIIFERKQ